MTWGDLRVGDVIEWTYVDLVIGVAHVMNRVEVTVFDLESAYTMDYTFLAADRLSQLEVTLWRAEP